MAQVSQIVPGVLGNSGISDVPGLPKPLVSVPGSGMGASLRAPGSARGALGRGQDFADVIVLTL